MIPPRRFRDRTERSPAVDARLARQLRVLSASPSVPRATRAGVAAGRRGRRGVFALRWAIIAGLCVVTAGGATAGVTYLVKVRTPAPSDNPRLEAPQPLPVPRAARPRVARAAPAPIEPDIEAPIEAPIAPAEPAARPTTTPSRRAPTARVPAAPTEGQLTEEARLMGQALSALREAGGGRAAMEALDTYDARFPHGALAMEAAAARAEALLLVGERTAALAILERLPLGSGANVGRWLLLRAELRAAAGRCAEALADFDGAWRGSTNADIRARARAGRAACEAQPR